MEITRICEIAKDLGQLDLVEKLDELGRKINQKDTPLILPLVGEFSSGKTTLINALTDSKQLETATKPTTATLYQICFGCDECKALVIQENGETTEVNICDLKNDNLQDAVGVRIFDTSTRVPASTILVDTPGLSSPDPRHKQVLVDFMPSADGVILVVDINQQITKSLTNFIKDMKLTGRGIYLVITKSDTKPPADRDAVKKYIAQNCELDLSQVACVSAKDEDMSELNSLLESVAKDKAKILSQVNEQRLKSIVEELAIRVDELLSETSSDEQLKKSLRNSKLELDKLNRNIARLIEDTEVNIKEVEETTCSKFSNQIFERLDSLIASKQVDFDQEAYSIIMGVTSQSLYQYKEQIQETVYQLARDRRNTEMGVNLHSLKEMDMSQFNISDLSYNLNLNALGHEYDGWIAGGAKLLIGVGIVATTIATAGGTTATVGTGSAVSTGVGTITQKTGVVLKAADTISDVANVASNMQLRKTVEQAQRIAQQTPAALGKVEQFNQNAGQGVGYSKGIVEGFVSKITSNMGKPQRQRAIHEYIENSLNPEFRVKMWEVSKGILSIIRNTLLTEASELVAQKQQSLEALEKQYETSQIEFVNRRSTLMNYREELRGQK